MYEQSGGLDVKALNGIKIYKALDRIISRSPLSSLAGRFFIERYFASGADGFGAPLKITKGLFHDYLDMQVPPNVFKKQVSFPHRGKPYLYKHFFIGSGSWGDVLGPLDERRVIAEVFEVFENDFNYKNTRAYRTRIEDAVSGNSDRIRSVWLDSAEKIDTYFETIISLIRSIAEYGYLGRAEVVNGTSFLSAIYKSPPCTEKEKGEEEIGCVIGPGGELFFLRYGHHRLAVVIKLGIPVVWVRVNMVHADWVKACKKRYSCDAVSAIRLGLKELKSRFSVAPYGA